ncbi:MAG TPA: hypothetical protein VLC48_01265 [Gemmatimonadota bacterium]|nr:hypothetical protein [Gemmatimonadota bacterium]
MRHAGLAALALSLLAASPLDGQTLRDQLSDLFRFGQCVDVDALLCISNASGQDAQFAFSAALESENERLIEFIGDALGQSVANIPTPATSSGTVVEFTPGGRIETRLLSSGPIYAERAPTLGRGRLLVGVLFSHMTYQQLRGVPIEDLVFNFRHVDIPGTPGFGDPVQENNILQVRMQLALRTTAASFFVTYGFANTFDMGVAIPLVYTSLSGVSEAQIGTFGENSVYSFGGPAEDPRLVDSSFQEASAVGIGDLGVRLKLNLRQGQRYGYALQGDLRLPTGSEENFHGLGSVAARVLGVVSAEFGWITPHANVGYLYRGHADSLQNHTVVGILGFDQIVTDGVTLALDLLSEFALDESAVRVPPDIEYTEPFTRTVVASTLPDRRDNRIDATIGFKWSVPCKEGWNTFCAQGAEAGTGVTLITSLVVPLNNGGLRPGIIWSLGAQYKF